MTTFLITDRCRITNATECIEYFCDSDNTCWKNLEVQIDPLDHRCRGICIRTANYDWTLLAMRGPVRAREQKKKKQRLIYIFFKSYEARRRNYKLPDGVEEVNPTFFQWWPLPVGGPCKRATKAGFFLLLPTACNSLLFFLSLIFSYSILFFNSRDFRGFISFNLLIFYLR